MEKLDLEIFRSLKNEVVDFFSKISDQEISKEEKDKIIKRYKEIIEVLSNHDLSDIPFDEWEGMILISNDEFGINLDFSKTKANFDFSKIEYRSDKKKVNFKGCNIRNFNFEEFKYIPEMFDGRFIEENKEYFLDEDVPDEIKKMYYDRKITLKDLSDNLKFFKGKKFFHSIENYSNGFFFIQCFGEKTVELLEKYKLLIDTMNVGNGTVLDELIVLKGSSEEEKMQAFASIIQNYFSHGMHVNSIKILKMITDFVPLDDLIIMPEIQSFLQKYDIDELLKVDFNIVYLTWNKKLSNLEEIKKYSSVIKKEDLESIITFENQQLLKKYSVDQLLEYGIKDLMELDKENPITDLKVIKEILDKRPIDLINFGSDIGVKIEFIKKYGIDNIIKLDEETNGIFSHRIKDGEDIYILLISLTDNALFKNEDSKEFTYEEFKDRMYEVLQYIDTSEQNYDFIEGQFREKYQDIFIDKTVSEEIREKFYMGEITAEDVRQNPELVNILKNKDLSRVFEGLDLKSETEKSCIQYLIEEVGKDEFLNFCKEYGRCLDAVVQHVAISLQTEKMTGRELLQDIFSEEFVTEFLQLAEEKFGIRANRDNDEIDDINDSKESNVKVQSIREKIEQEIYENIKKERLQYGEFLPDSFKEKYPDLFLPEEIDEEIRNRFYKGEMTFEDIRKNPEIKDILLEKDLGVGYGKLITVRFNIWSKLSNNIQHKKEILDYAEEYGTYFIVIDINVLDNLKENDEKISYIHAKIEESIISRKFKYNENVPEFFKGRHPELFLSDDAPKELKKVFYDSNVNKANPFDVSGDNLSFKLIKEHPEWKKFLVGKDLSRAFPKEYEELFKRFDSSTLLKLGLRNPETIEKIVQKHREETMENWYKATGGKFLPHHVVMLNFPEAEIDSFLANGKRWSQLMRLDRYNLNDDGKDAILKSAYTMGVFTGDDDAFNRIMKLFTDIPQELNQEEYEKVDRIFSMYGPEGEVWGDIYYDEETISLFKNAYILNDDGKYVFCMDKQKNKNTVRIIREILEKAQISKILTPQKAHQIFDSFKMEYDPDFVKFFNDNLEEILSNSECLKDIATIQRRFREIKIENSGRKLTLELARNYIKTVAYDNCDIGNEKLSERVSKEGYSQEDFERLQELYNEGESRDYSSIPRVTGEINGYTYEMLRCDDSLALVIGPLTNCCQKLDGVGHTSMEHSMVSSDGRVFVVRDDEGRIIAQSWVWRNQYTVCFDNIEIPNSIVDMYEREYPDLGSKGLTRNVLEVYKKATQDLIQEDEKVYKELLENGTITREQYDALVVGRVTIGAGWSDIKEALREAYKKGDIIGLDQSNEVLPIKTERMSYIYDDAHYEKDDEHDGQYIVSQKDSIVKSSFENLYVHQDDIPVYDVNNMTSTVLFTIQKMEKSSGREKLSHLDVESKDKEFQKSQKIISQLSSEYGIDSESTKVIATARMAMIYSVENGKIKIADLFTSPIKEELTDEQKEKSQKHIMYQIKKALKQIGVSTEEFDISSLEEEQKKILQNAMQEIDKESSERSEK